MKTHYQIREKRKFNRQIRAYKYKNWKWGKNCNSIIKDRSNGAIYGATSGGRLDWRLGDYTGPTTRSMTDFREREKLNDIFIKFAKELNDNNIPWKIINKFSKYRNKILNNMYGDHL